MSRDDKQYTKLTPAERQEEYLQLLQEKNRIKKHLTNKSKQEAENEEREKGFSTHFAGANAVGKTKKKKIVTGTGKLKLEDVTAPKDKGRRRWSTDRPDDGPQAEGGGVQIPLGEWGKKPSSANRRWSLGSAEESPRDESGRTGGSIQSAVEDEAADVEVSEDDNYEDDYEEDFEEEVVEPLSRCRVELSRPSAGRESLDIEADSLRISNSSQPIAALYSHRGSGGKMRIEKEVVRLNSASGARPQSSGFLGTSSDLNGAQWGAQELPVRPISNQSGLRASSSRANADVSSPSKVRAQAEVPMSLKPTPTRAVSPGKEASKKSADVDKSVINPNNVSSVLDNSLIDKVSDLDERQRQKLLSYLMGGDKNVPSDADGADDAPAQKFTATGTNLKKSAGWSQSGGTSSSALGGLSATTDFSTPRSLNLSQMATVPMIKQDPVPGTLAIQSAQRAKEEMAVSTMDGELSISGMSEMFKTPEVPFSSLTADIVTNDVDLAEVSSRLSTVREGAEDSPISSQDVSITVNFRIRIHNGWTEEKSKKRYISLRRVGLRLAGSPIEVDTSSLDIALFCGLTPLAKSSESVTMVRRLFSARSHLGAVDSRAGEWRGPYDTGNPLEIRVTGTLRVNSALCEEALRVSGCEPLADGSIPSDVLELVISNGLCLPARDADVYNGLKCVWSGCFDQLLNGGNDPASRPDPKELQSALLVIPLRQKLRGATNKPRSETSSPSLSAEVKSTHASASTVNNTSAAPVWLAENSMGHQKLLSTPFTTESQTDSNEVLRRSIQAKRRSEDLVFDVPETTVMAEGNVEEAVGPMPRLDSAKPKSSHSKARRQKKKDDDDALRQSLDALEHSNRLNRGRLRGGRRAVADSSNVNSIEVDPGQKLDAIFISKKDADMRDKIAMNQMVPEKGETSKLSAHVSGLEEVSSVVSPKPQIDKANGQDRRLQKRSEKIDQVQETVRSALANLAGVMSNMNVVPKSAASRGSNSSSPAALDNTPRIRVSPLTVLAEEKSKAVVPEDSVPSTAAAAGVSESEDTFSDLEDDKFDIIGAEESNHLLNPDVNILEGSLGEIPVLPSGTTLRLEILSTWGDNYYVGLNGFDIFDGQGRLLRYCAQGPGDKLASKKGVVYSPVLIRRISGNPSDINVLEEYENDPRHVENLVDPCNFTKDDMHVWLAPRGEMVYEKEFDSSTGQSDLRNNSGERITYITDATSRKHAVIATVTLEFSEELPISMIRIWNYNKSRTHCLRGVRRARLLLDSKVIFDGEIRIAPGTLESAESCSEVVLFSTDMEILASVAEHDGIAGYHGQTKAVNVDEAAQNWIEKLNHQKNMQRPRTADTTSGADALSESTADLLSSLPNRDQPLARPTTSAGGGMSRRGDKLSESVEFMNSLQDQLSVTDARHATTGLKNATGRTGENQNLPTVSAGPILSDKDLVSVRVLSLTIESTWGDRSYVGIGGLEVLTGRNSVAARIDGDMVDADPRDLSVIGCFDDARTPDKLVNGINETTDDSNFWLIPFSKGSCHRVTIDLGSTCGVAGLRLWNYNKSPEDALRGAKVISVWADNKYVGQLVARIAPGCDGVNFGQTVYFKDLPNFVGPPSNKLVKSYITPSIRQTYETPISPRGMLWKFSIYSNWGDSYYVGLDGMEFLNEFGDPINVIPVVENDNGKLASTTTLVSDTLQRKNEQKGTVHALVTAVPFSVQDLNKDGGSASNSVDQRVPNNLFNGANRDSSGHNSWLAPIAHCMEPHERRQRGINVRRSQKGWTDSRHELDNQNADFFFFGENVLYVLFDYPVAVSAIRLYNYSKNPGRGARDFSIEVDDRLLYMGTIAAALEDSHCDRALPDTKNTLGACSVVFTNDPKTVKFEKDKVQYTGLSDQDVLHIDERKVMVRSKGMFDKPSPTTEGVVTDVLKRPMTSMTRT